MCVVVVVMRIWDCVLWEGNVVLFRVGLALCKAMVSADYDTSSILGISYYHIM